ncbi:MULTISPECIES: DUF4185 domain-containing protein [unclassified Rhodococcus (in: high G+C Gram-positive bacteria)]|uniref:DUF4185 domain-containing protein n=1 Tax=unclassified Rhodococcus (in: high G+C Gram-positive bacteria) TaxID=192944 RepID=UPI001F2AEBA3|nr:MULTISPECIES: DUF4185 domain-containing protein [unclassified Rhodococcus (in: high G+C Gram-positive bacteria)]
MRRQRAMAAALALALVGGVSLVLAPVAAAEPCGGLPGTGIDGTGFPGQPPAGRQGPVPAYNGPSTSTVGWVTGQESVNRTFDRFGISGTDLGISWDNGAGQTLMAFGDTFGNCAVPGGQWRHNVLLRSNDTDLSDGITFADGVPGDVNSGAVVAGNDPRFATQLLSALGLSPVEYTIVPTSAIAVNGVQYLHFMSVREWSGSVWSTNYAGIATSRDNGQTWFPEPATIRFNSGVTVPGTEQLDARFQQAAFVRGQDGFMYQYGTPNGRLGAAYLARVAPDAMLDLTRYEYWNGGSWTSDLAAAAPVVGQPVGEMSVAWNAYLGRYIMLYGNDVEGRIMARTASAPEGPWSAPTALVVNNDIGNYPGGGLYAPYIHPRSAGDSLYFTASQYSSYNVILMRTDLDALPR